ncbi:hypothetical protein QE152_g39857 [Popillia japonica]|uniref:Uncharacterized protein n=1 Tax=Popillia japonica TaxID=7064 RepID=A0AAW1HT11_POPJA
MSDSNDSFFTEDVLTQFDAVTHNLNDPRYDSCQNTNEDRTLKTGVNQQSDCDMIFADNSLIEENNNLIEEHLVVSRMILRCLESKGYVGGKGI